MQCIKHPLRPAIDICSVCGNGLCTACRGTGQPETICADCKNKHVDDAVCISVTDSGGNGIAGRLDKKRKLITYILITILYLVMLWSYISPWHGGALSISAISSLTVSLILQGALFIRNSVWMKSATAIAAIINFVLFLFDISLFVDSSSMLGVASMIVIAPFILWATFDEVVSDRTLLGIILVAWIILALLLGMTCGLRFWW